MIETITETTELPVERVTKLRPAPTEVVTPLRPSEALRLGRMLYPERCTGVLFDGTGVCAAGAIAVGYGWTPSTANDDQRAGYVLLNASPLRFHVSAVFARNDRGFSDAEILTYLEGFGL